MKYRKIESIEQLDAALDEGLHNYFISFGIARSSKDIFHGEKEGFYEIYNYIDDTEIVLTREQVFDKDWTNIGEAITKGCFYAYEDDKPANEWD